MFVFMQLIRHLVTVAYSKVLSWHASVGLQGTSTVWSIILLEKRKVAYLVIKFSRLRLEIYSHDCVFRQLNAVHTPFLKNPCQYYFPIYA